MLHRLSGLGGAVGLALCLNSGYLAATAEPSLFYLANVGFHVVGGVLFAPLLGVAGWRLWKWCQPRATVSSRRLMALAGGLILLGFGTGLAIICIGNTRDHQWLLNTHIGLCVAAIIGVLMGLASLRQQFSSTQRQMWRVAFGTVVGTVLVAGFFAARPLWRPESFRVVNPVLPPLSQDDEGMGGQDGPFHPAGVHTNTGGRIPSDFFMTSKRCGDCHQDIYRQWAESAHHFSSFNNQWYRKSIEYMQDVLGTRSSRWCAGCHDVALLLNGMMDTPVRELLDTPEAHVGLACTACHAITQVRDTMGNGNYEITYPALHDWMNSDRPWLHALHDFLVHVDPRPHRRIFLKPFHYNEQSPAFCSTCHKVHLDTHVNNYRWFRGFNEYDAWQASGVSGYGARSFYYPDAPQTCNDCHMPLVPSDDPGHRQGLVHSHRFPGANTALPTANRHDKQLDITMALLRSGVVSLDIFAISPAPSSPHLSAASGAENNGPAALATTFPVGEEQALRIGHRSQQPVRQITAPLDAAEVAVQRGSEVIVDVVVRNRGVGHFFPGGTLDAFDVWVEFQAVDDRGQLLFWSGAVADNGRGPVEPYAHRYGALLVDAHGNAINKRNAWAARAVVYAHAIPPGSADVVHYRLTVPEHAGERLTLTAKLHYRKFRWWHTQWAYAGERDPKPPEPAVSPHYDDGKWVFTGDTSGVSGAVKDIPDVPIATMASDTVTLRVADATVPLTTPPPPHRQSGPERWNDYGIGLLRQGDLRGAEVAFRHVSELAPDTADGWVNLGRVHLQDGDLDRARRVLTKALELRPKLPRGLFFLAMVLKAEGDYETALGHLRQVAEVYPQDRVVRNQMGRLLFLLGQYPAARTELEAVLRIDPEDLQAHYNLMLCYRALGDEARAETHHRLYLRFKADESAQVIAGKARQRDPGANLESQPVHEHRSMPLPPAPAFTTTGG
ncbi:tetratricopeptide repeat protein [Candidatus Entotheonella palauensis]|nr:tetratricopeptide repeat protein [Candidatus Entotheonella palauensis]